MYLFHWAQVSDELYSSLNEKVLDVFLFWLLSELYSTFLHNMPCAMPSICLATTREGIRLDGCNSCDTRSKNFASRKTQKRNKIQRSIKSTLWLISLVFTWSLLFFFFRLHSQMGVLSYRMVERAWESSLHLGLSQVVLHRLWWMTAGRQVLVCFNPDAESLGDPVREKQQYCDVGELVKVEHKSFCILHQIQGYSGIQPGVSYSTPTSKWQETSSLRCCDVIYQYCPKCTKIS